MKCLRCGRELKSEKAINLGYGPICLSKHKKNIPRKKKKSELKGFFNKVMKNE